MLPTYSTWRNPMDKIKEITIKLKRWQAGMILSALMILLSYLLAVTSPMGHTTVSLFHILGMFTTGVAGTVLFIFSTLAMLEEWDK